MKDSVGYYDQNAMNYVNTTKDADMTYVHSAFLGLMQKKNENKQNEQLRILDLGCGSGRDTKYFLSQGYLVDAIDGSYEMAKEASLLTGIHVEHVRFEDFIPKHDYDGIFACASLLHLDTKHLLEVFQMLSNHLNKNGVIYASFKYGEIEYEKDGRYFNNFDETKFDSLMNHVTGLTTIKTFVTNDVRKGREHERWLNIFLKKTSS